MSDPLQSVEVACPYCGEAFETLLDSPEAGVRYIEDCPVCCRPIEFSVGLTPEGFSVTPRRDDD